MMISNCQQLGANANGTNRLCQKQSETWQPWRNVWCWSARAARATLPRHDSIWAIYIYFLPIGKTFNTVKQFQIFKWSHKLIKITNEFKWIRMKRAGKKRMFVKQSHQEFKHFVSVTRTANRRSWVLRWVRQRSPSRTRLSPTWAAGPATPTAKNKITSHATHHEQIMSWRYDLLMMRN